MRRRGAEALVPFDPDIDRTECRNRRARREREAMERDADGNPIIPQGQPAARETIRQYAQPEGAYDFEQAAADQLQIPFSVAPAFITMLQSKPFSGQENENPNDHLEWVRMIC